VHARLVLELRVGAAPGDAGDDLLDAPGRPARHRENLDAPPEALGEARVHPEQIGGEQGGLLAAGAGPDLEQDVLLVVRILGHEQLFERLLQPLLLARQLPLFLTRHLAHLGVLLHLARFVDALADLAVLTQRFDQLTQIRVLLAELLHLLAVRQHSRVREEPGELLVAVLYRGKLIEQ
jgi:hypothetical protein